MTDQTTYTEDELNALSAEDVEKLAADLGVEPETGSGVNGNVLKPDRVAAILAAQRTEGDDGDQARAELVEQLDNSDDTLIAAFAGALGIESEPYDRQESIDTILAYRDEDPEKFADELAAYRAQNGGVDAEAEAWKENDVAPGDRVEIRRTSERAWWCPICDYSHPHGSTLCTGCGAERDGEEVIASGDR